METKHNDETSNEDGKQEGEDKVKVAEAIFAKYSILFLFIYLFITCVFVCFLLKIIICPKKCTPTRTPDNWSYYPNV